MRWLLVLLFIFSCSSKDSLPKFSYKDNVKLIKQHKEFGTFYKCSRKGYVEDYEKSSVCKQNNIYLVNYKCKLIDAGRIWTCEESLEKL